jgi:hypothetical protein
MMKFKKLAEADGLVVASMKKEEEEEQNSQGGEDLKYWQALAFLVTPSASQCRLQ